MKKTDRIKIWEDMEKCCGYCGNSLKYENMQIDHKISKRLGGTDDRDNLIASCRRCNHYKRARSIESFRDLLSTIQKRIMKNYICKVAYDYGIIKFTPFDGKFFFEEK